MKSVKHSTWYVLISAMLVLSVGACSTVKEKFSMRGQGEVRTLSQSKFEVTESGNDFFEKRSDVYDRWEARASTACKGTKYNVVKRDYDSSQSPLVRVNGIVECNSK